METPTLHADTVTKNMIFIQYRGKGTDEYAKALHTINVPCTLIMTLRKLRTTMPSLKPQVEKTLQSGTVYRIKSPRCRQSCYVGQTSRHILSRFREHATRAQAVRKHFNKCGVELSMNSVDLLKTSSRGESHLLTLEALFIEEEKPKINTKEEWRSRTLTVNFF